MKIVAECQDYQKGGTQKNHYSVDEVTHVTCPLCGTDEPIPIYKEHGSIEVVRCKSCDLIYTSPRIHSPEEVYWGDADAYCDEARLVFEGKMPHHRDPNYLEEIRFCERFSEIGRFMDVGCNMGILLRLARKRGWETVGVEPSPSLSHLAQKHGYPVYNCFLHQVPETEFGNYDVVALSDVLEHISEPIQFLQTARRFFNMNGILYVKVPNARWNVFKQALLNMMGRRPDQGLWDSYEHVVHYTDRTLQKMLQTAGFRVDKLTFGRPVQTPVWHERVGRYFQYPSPFFLDWCRQAVRTLSYHAAKFEWILRFGSIGYLAPNLVAVARKCG